jgi:hypothetical protein
MPPTYILIHRVSTAGIGVLCQLGCEGRFRAEVIRWMPGYGDPAEPGNGDRDELDQPSPGRDDDPDGAIAGAASPGS